MRYLLLCLAISLTAVQFSPVENAPTNTSRNCWDCECEAPVEESESESSDELSEVYPCCCCECPPVEAKTISHIEPTSVQLAELNRFYGSTTPQEKSFEIWMLEMEVLNFDSYFMCGQCDHVAGPGIDHPYRHPASKRRPAPPQLDAETKVEGCGLDCSENLKIVSSD